MSKITPPLHVQALRKRLENLTGDASRRQLLEKMLAQVVVAQLLPKSAIKGGSAMKLRLGIEGSRFSQDLDVAKKQDLQNFISDLEASLSAGWAGFTGTVRSTNKVSKPAGVPSHYIMKAFEVKLKYRNRDFLTLLLEVGHDELDDTENPELELSADIATLFEQLGLPKPVPVAVVAKDHQIAQKLHALSAPRSTRAHDLVDLQLLVRASHYSDQQVVDLCRRLFAFRKAHSWPPLIEIQEGWVELYDASAFGLGVEPDVIKAITWVNGYIRRLEATESRP